MPLAARKLVASVLSVDVANNGEMHTYLRITGSPFCCAIVGARRQGSRRRSRALARSTGGPECRRNAKAVRLWGQKCPVSASSKQRHSMVLDGARELCRPAKGSTQIRCE
jgi:hypothetical protein